MTDGHEIVTLFDCDNTLLDNDGVQDDLRRHLASDVLSADAPAVGVADREVEVNHGRHFGGREGMPLVIASPLPSPSQMERGEILLAPLDAARGARYVGE